MIWLKLDDRIDGRFGIAYRMRDSPPAGEGYGIAGWYANEAERDALFEVYGRVRRAAGSRGPARRLADLLCEAVKAVSGEPLDRSIDDVRYDLERACIEQHHAAGLQEQAGGEN